MEVYWLLMKTTRSESQAIGLKREAVGSTGSLMGAGQTRI